MTVPLLPPGIVFRNSDVLQRTLPRERVTVISNRATEERHACGIIPLGASINDIHKIYGLGCFTPSPSVGTVCPQILGINFLPPSSPHSVWTSCMGAPDLTWVYGARRRGRGKARTILSGLETLAHGLKEARWKTILSHANALLQIKFYMEMSGP